jgi:hypothetical protein
MQESNEARAKRRIKQYWRRFFTFFNLSQYNAEAKLISAATNRKPDSIKSTKR